GHRAGIDALRRVAEAAPDLGVDTLTVYAFSADNWRRPRAEVTALLGLLKHYLHTEVTRLLRNDTRLSVIGRRDRLPPEIAGSIGEAERITAHGRKLHLRIAFDYSARDAILQAVAASRNDGTLTREAVSRQLAGDGTVRDVDLLIRTSGEQRLSDFLLWECAYSELYFTDCLWPDFGGEELQAAIADFRGRNRRYGGLSGKDEAEAGRTAPPGGKESGRPLVRPQ
ncbi:MAG: polyprenyl diphosphate synthase, partial [Alphaproteobacteria bacterium]